MEGQPVKAASHDRIPFDQCFTVGESQNVKTEFVQLHGPSRIAFEPFDLEVLAAVQFDDQSGLDAHEVREVPADRVLSAELVALELSIAQTLPEGVLGVRRGPAQCTSPHPNPLPRAGEGT